MNSILRSWRIWRRSRCGGTGFRRRYCAVVDQIFQFLARLEVWHALGRHFDLLTRFGVPAYASVTLTNSETSKSAHFQFIAIAKGLDYALEQRIDNDFGIFPG